MFVWSATSTVITAAVLTVLYTFMVLIAILAVAPGLQHKIPSVHILIHVGISYRDNHVS